MRALSGEYVCVECVHCGTCFDEDSKISSFKPNIIENYSMFTYILIQRISLTKFNLLHNEEADTLHVHILGFVILIGCKAKY
jgi:hypothetical protein